MWRAWTNDEIDEIDELKETTLLDNHSEDSVNKDSVIEVILEGIIGCVSICDRG
jgi:hypothetical protein